LAGAVRSPCSTALNPRKGKYAKQPVQEHSKQEPFSWQSQLVMNMKIGEHRFCTGVATGSFATIITSSISSSFWTSLQAVPGTVKIVMKKRRKLHTQGSCLRFIGRDHFP
jgi:hypothetical protein